MVRVGVKKTQTEFWTNTKTTNFFFYPNFNLSPKLDHATQYKIKSNIIKKCQK